MSHKLCYNPQKQFHVVLADTIVAWIMSRSNFFSCVDRFNSNTNSILVKISERLQFCLNANQHVFRLIAGIFWIKPRPSFLGNLMMIRPKHNHVFMANQLACSQFIRVVKVNQVNQKN